jgi:putative permease
MNTLRDWFRRNLSDPHVVALALVVVVVGVSVWLFGSMLAPLIAAVVIAYLLDSLALRLVSMGVPRIPAFLGVFLLFVALLLIAFFWLFALVSESQIRELLAGISSEVVGMGQAIVSFSVSSVVTVITIGVYLVLVPILVFFMLKDKALIIRWFQGFMPRQRRLTDQVWAEVDKQLGNYVRGKFLEILIVGIAMWMVFRFLGLQYAVLLATVTGLSVLIPYVGATVVTIPVALVAYFQFGLAPGFYYALVGYGIVQFLDGNVLVPLLFSEVVDLHPVAIITAILFFGGVWGFWGVFFAIPLATAIQAILRAWPRASGTPAGAAPPA